MRLIDADKIPYVQDVTYMKDYDYAYRYAIEAEPTVDAIPIEWIEQYVKSKTALLGDSELWMKWMIDEWKARQEKQNEKT